MNESNDSVISWSSKTSVASTDNRNGNHEAAGKIRRSCPTELTDRPSRPNLDEGNGPAGSFIVMKAVSTPQLYT